MELVGAAVSYITWCVGYDGLMLAKVPESPSVACDVRDHATRLLAPEFGVWRDVGAGQPLERTRLM